jgi:hypothetical protein
MPQRDAAKERYWRRLVRRWQRSELTARDFSARQGISEANFHYWRRELARRDGQAATSRKRSAPTFLKLTVDPSATKPPAIELVLSERRLLRVRPGFDADLLRQLIRLLEEPVC